MSTITCPRCDNPTGRLLAAASQLARVDYYGCDRCLLVWHEPKTAAGSGNDAASDDTGHDEPRRRLDRRLQYFKEERP